MKRLAPLLMSLPPLLAQAAPAEESTPFAVTFENDVFVNSDDNYTDGVQIAWARRKPADGPLEQPLLASICRHFGCDARQEAAITHKIGQLMYTPTDITNPAPQPDDHPWAGMLYYQRSYDLSVSERESISVSGLAGVIGPHALAKQAQKFIHRHITNSPDPQGWHNQIGNALGLMATLEQRKSIGYLLGDPERWSLNSAWYWRAAAGNVTTSAAIGLSFRYGYRQPALVMGDSSGISTKSGPMIENSAARSTAPGSACLGQAWLDCSLTANIELRAVAYNVFLDGRWGHDDPHVDSKVLVADTSLGLRLALPRHKLGHFGTPFIMFQITQRSAEYRSAKAPGAQAWGAITVGADFP